MIQQYNFVNMQQNGPRFNPLGGAKSKWSFSSSKDDNIGVERTNGEVENTPEKTSSATHSSDLTVIEKCHNFIRREYGKRRKNHISVGELGSWRNSRRFRQAWEVHRHLEISRVHDGNFEVIAELNLDIDPYAPPNLIISQQKRVSD